MNVGRLKSLFVVILMAAATVLAAPPRTTYQAKIIKPDGYPLEAANVNFRFSILDPSATCAIYVEDYAAVNMIDSGGLISFSLGSGVRSFPTSGPAATFSAVFDNSITSFSCQSPGIFSPVANDIRKIAMQFNDGGGWQTLPAMTINAVPYAMYAGKSDNSIQLNGKSDTAFVEYSTLASLSCQSNEAIKFNGVSFGCIAISSATAVTSGSVITALGYTPADGASVTALTASLTSTDSNVSSVSSTVFSVSSTVSSLAGSISSLQTSVAASFSAITSSQWSSVASGISYSSGNVGIGTSTPVTRLDVLGGVRIGAESTTCAPALAGTLRYNASNIEYCNGTSWQAFGVSGAGITNFNGSTSGTQSFATGAGGTAPNFNTANGVHTLNLPLASTGSVTAGLISNTDYTAFTNKITSSAASIAQVLGYVPADNAVSGTYAQKANNLSDLTNVVTARTNLGLGTFATASTIDLGSASATGTLAIARLPSFTGDATIAAASNTIVLSNSGVTTGTYSKVTVDTKGRVTNGAQITSGDVTTALGYTPASASASSQWATSGTSIYYNTGNVGIGTASPGTALDVLGIISSRSSSTWGSGANSMFKAVDQNGLLFSLGLDGGNSKLELNTQYSTMPIVFSVANSEKMRVTSTGYVGIGSNAPANALHVIGKGTSANSLLGSMSNAAVVIQPNTASLWSVGFGVITGTSYTQYLQAANPAGSLAKNFVINPFGGNVGIGIQAPEARLHLTSGIAAAGTAPLKFTSGTLMTAAEAGALEYDGFNFYITDSTNTRRAIATGSSANTIDNASNINSSANITMTPDGGSVIVSATTASTNTNTGALVVKGGLGVAGNINAGGSITTSANIQGVSVTATSGMISPYIAGSVNASGSLTLDSTTHATKGNILLAPNGGNVGIGTTTPSAKLQVNGSLFAAVGTYAGKIQELGNGTSIQSTLISDDNSKGVLTLNAWGGNVGIGTASPAQKLDVKGGGLWVHSTDNNVSRQDNIFLGEMFDSAVTPLYSIATNDANDGFYLVSQRFNSTFNLSRMSGTGEHAVMTVNAGTGAQTTLSLYHSDTDTSKVHLATGGDSYLTGGNVGIGTSNPTYNLDIDVKTADMRIKNTGASGYPVQYMDSYSDFAAWAGAALIMRRARGTEGSPTYVNSGDSLGYIAFRDHLGGGGALVGTIATEAHSATSKGTALIFQTNNNAVVAATEKMRIDHNGNVGIGTTTPSAKLHIAAGTSSIAPLKFTSGTLLASAQSGTVEYDGNYLYFTDGTNTRRTIASTAGAGTYDNASLISNSSGNIVMHPNSGAGSVVVSATTASTNTNTGALVVKGGLGVAGDINAGGTIQGVSVTATNGMISPYIAGSVNASGNLTLDSTTHATKGNIFLAPNGGSVGIGTTTPGSKFSVKGVRQGTITSTNSIMQVGGDDVFLYMGAGDGIGNSYPIMLQAMRDSDSAPFPLVINPNGGNVGIGMSSPSTNLDISGSDQSVAVRTTNLSSTSSKYPGFSAVNYSGNVGGFPAVNVTNFRGNSASLALLQAADYIGVFNGQVATNTSGTLVNTAQIAFKASANHTSSTTSSQIDFFTTPQGSTNMSNRMTIADSGNVGIGTTSPRAKLEIANGANSDAAILATSNENNRLVVKSWDTQPTIVQTFGLVHNFNGDENNGFLKFHRGGSTSGGFVALGSSGSERMRIDTSGNVGIGTTTPATDLEIKGSVAALTLTRSVSSAASPDIYLQKDRGVSVPVISGDTIGHIGFRGLTGNVNYVRGARISSFVTSAPGYGLLGADLRFYTNDSTADAVERLRILANGNVGIGTTTPSSDTGWTSPALDISGSRGSVIIRTTASNGLSTLRFVGPTSGSDMHVNFDDSSGSLKFMPQSGAILGLVQEKTGNVGIGITNPGAKLDVSNSTTFLSNGTGANTYFRNSQSTDGDYLAIGWTSENVWGISSADSGTYRNLSLQPHGGNVGVGTQYPDRLFEVAGTIEARDLNAGGATDGAIRIKGNSQGSPYGTIQFVNTAGNTQWAFISGSSAGNIGINTIAPTEKLHVVGNLRVQGSTDCTLGNGAGGTNCSSDARLKENIKPIPYALEKINSLKGVEFDWNEKSISHGRHDIGVIAQDVEKVFPTAVMNDKNTGYKKVDYAVLVAPIIQAVKELYAFVVNRFDRYDRQIASKAESAEVQGLKAKTEKLEAENLQLKQQNETIKVYLCSQNPSAPFCK